MFNVPVSSCLRADGVTCWHVDAAWGTGHRQRTDGRNGSQRLEPAVGKDIPGIQAAAGEEVTRRRHTPHRFGRLTHLIRHYSDKKRAIR